MSDDSVRAKAMASDRPEYVHCIERPWTKPLDRSTFCGRPLEVFDWSFMSLFHATEAARQGSRLVPCEECVRKAERDEVAPPSDP